MIDKRTPDGVYTTDVRHFFVQTMITASGSYGKVSWAQVHPHLIGCPPQLWIQTDVAEGSIFGSTPIGWEVALCMIFPTKDHEKTLMLCWQNFF